MLQGRDVRKETLDFNALLLYQAVVSPGRHKFRKTPHSALLQLFGTVGMTCTDV
jgi:hypothetical protein